jgi:hypothetical protein
MADRGPWQYDDADDRFVALSQALRKRHKA